MNKKNSHIFIVGLQKSGTTMLLALLDAHTQLLVLPTESRFLPKKEKFLRVNKSAESVCDFVMNESGFATFNPETEKFKTETFGRKKDYLDSINGDYFKKALYEELLQKKFPLPMPDLFDAVARAYRQTLGKNKKGQIIVEKTPGNEFYADYIKHFFPGSNILHIVREPFDNAASYIAYQKTQDVDHNYSFFLASLRSLAVYVKNQDDPSYKLVRYEDIVSDTENQMRDISNWLGIDFEESMIHPTLSDGKPWKGNSSANVTFNRVSKDRVKSSGKRLLTEDVLILKALYGVENVSLFSFLKALLKAPVSGKNKLKTIAYYFYARLFLRRSLQTMRSLYFAN